MKPETAEQIRGIYRPIRTSAPGISICEKLPHMAPHMDKVTLIRTVRHEMRNHNSAGYYSLTGFAPPTDDQRLRDSRELFPAYGSIVDRFAPARPGTPTFVSYPYTLADGSITPGQHASFLGNSFDPLFINQDPNSPDFRLPELSSPALHHGRTAQQSPRGDEPDRSLHRNDGDLRPRPRHRFALPAGVDAADQPDVSPSVRPVKRTDGGARTLWPHHLRPRLLAGAAARRGRRQVRHRLLRPEHWRAVESDGGLGHARLQRCADVSDPQRLPAADHRPDAADVDRGPRPARLARRHADRLGRRVRPQPAHQQHRWPRPLAAVLHRPDGRRWRQARPRPRRQ